MTRICSISGVPRIAQTKVFTTPRSGAKRLIEPNATTRPSGIANNSVSPNRWQFSQKDSVRRPQITAASLELAREGHPELKFLPGNALDFTLDEPVDAVFSNAVLHWIDADKQQAMLDHIASQIKPGGLLVCEFGGKGCAETVHAALEKRFAAHGRCGVYLRVVEPGTVRAGEEITLCGAPNHDVDMLTAFAAAMGDNDAAAGVVAAECLPTMYHERLATRLSLAS